MPHVEPGGGHGSCLELFRAQPALEWGSLWLRCRLGVKVDGRPLRGSPGAIDCRTTFSGFSWRVKHGVADLLILQGLLCKPLRRTGEGLLNLKDLLTLSPPSGRSTFSGFVGYLKRDEAYLLIPRWLLAKLRRRTGEGLLNLKDLLTGLPPRLKGLFEKEAVLRRPFGYQIVPNFAIFDHKRAANCPEQGFKHGFFGDRFIKTCQVLCLMSRLEWGSRRSSQRSRKR